MQVWLTHIHTDRQEMGIYINNLKKERERDMWLHPIVHLLTHHFTSWFVAYCFYFDNKDVIYLFILETHAKKSQIILTCCIAFLKTIKMETIQAVRRKAQVKQLNGSHFLHLQNICCEEQLYCLSEVQMTLNKLDRKDARCIMRKCFRLFQVNNINIWAVKTCSNSASLFCLSDWR